MKILPLLNSTEEYILYNFQTGKEKLFKIVDNDILYLDYLNVNEKMFIQDYFIFRTKKKQKQKIKRKYDHNEVKRLSSQGWKNIDIAKHIGSSHQTISDILNYG